MKKTKIEQTRLILFKKQIKENKIEVLENLSNEELYKILDISVLPNSFSLNSVKMQIILNYIFIERKEKKDRFINNMNRIISFVDNLTKTEKVILKYAVIRGFETKLWRNEFFKFLKTPLSFKTAATERKILSSTKFKEVFFFAFNLINRGKQNGRLPKF